MKTFIVDSSNSMFATSEPLPSNFQLLTFESNILAALEAEVSNACFIVYPSLSRLLANSIDETGQVALAENRLLDAIEQIINFYKRNRKRCTLLYLSDQNLAPLNLNHREKLTKLISQTSAKPSGVMEFIAASTMLANREFGKRLAELESCSCGDITFELQVNAQHGVDAVLKLQNENEKKLTDAVIKNAHIRDAIATEEQAKRAELEQENEQVIKQLHSLQELFEENLEQFNRTKHKLGVVKKEVADIKIALTSEKQVVQQLKETEQKAAQEKHKLLQQQLIEKEQENEQLIEQLHYTQELLELEYENKAQQQKHFKAVSQERSALFKNLEEAKVVQVWLRSALTEANQRLWAKSRKFRSEIKRQAKLLQESAEFVERQYLEMYPDTKNSSLEPAVHYLVFGAIEARNPSNTFNSLSYIQKYSDIAESGLNPLLHYVRHGQYEGRKPNPMLVQLPAPKD